VGNGQIKGDDGKRAQNPFQECLPAISPYFRVGTVDTGEQLAGGDRRERDSRSGKGTCQEIGGELSPSISYFS